MLRGTKIFNINCKPLLAAFTRTCTFRNILLNRPPYVESEIGNGLKVVSELTQVDHVCVGLFFDAGSRYESDKEHGSSHFFEHIAFSSAPDLTRKEIQQRMDSIGARVKSFTTREFCGYYAEAPASSLPILMELLGLCIFCNCYDVTEIEREKFNLYNKIIEDDNNSNILLDEYLHGAAFHGTPLGRAVVGPTTNLFNFNPTSIKLFHDNFINPHRGVLCAVGNVDHYELHKLAERHMCMMGLDKCIDSVYRFSAGDFRFRDDAMPLCNVAIAFETPGLSSPDTVVLDVASTYIGAWDRSQPGGYNHSFHIARASSVIHASEAYRAFYIKYKETGLWGVQFMSDRKAMDDMMYHLQNQLLGLCTTITECELRRAKAQAILRLLGSVETSTRTALDLARRILYVGSRRTLLQRIEQIEAVPLQKVKDVCMHYLYDRCPAIAAIGPCEGLPEYTRLRGNQWWMRL